MRNVLFVVCCFFTEGAETGLNRRGIFKRQKTGQRRYLWSTKTAKKKKKPSPLPLPLPIKASPLSLLFSLKNRGSGRASDVSIIHCGTSSFYGAAISRQEVEGGSWYTATRLILPSFISATRSLRHRYELHYNERAM